MLESGKEWGLPQETLCGNKHGGLLHQFECASCTAWIVEPPEALDKDKCKRWFWVPEWPNAFPARNGVCELLKLGYYMIHINVRGLCGNPEAVRKMKALYDAVRTLGFAPRGAMIGMSLGGLYSFRYAAAYPETVSCIYADAPACDLYYRHRKNRADAAEISRAYGVEDHPEQLIEHPLSPLQNHRPIIDAGIPLLMILGADDQVVPPELNGRLLAERWRAAGGEVELIERPSWGHHPHGLDDPAKIVRFVLRHTSGQTN